jgi:tetratricopeptide (TPR) repeat protein
VYLAIDDLPRAREIFERALERGPSISSYSNLGAIHHWEGRYAEAIAAYERAIALLPNDPLLHGNVGDAWRRLGNRAKANEAYEQAIRLSEAELRVNPADLATRANLAVYEAKAGRVDDALQRVATLPPDAEGSSEAAYATAVVLAIAGRSDAAVERLRKAFLLGYSRALAARDDDLQHVRALIEEEDR